MRPRDFNIRDFREGHLTLHLSNGVLVSANWVYSGVVELAVENKTAQVKLPVPRDVFDRMCDWYASALDKEFWDQSYAIESIEINEEWKIGVMIFPSGEGNPLGRKMVGILRSGPDLRIINSIMFNPDEFAQVVKWYNGELAEKAAA